MIKCNTCGKEKIPTKSKNTNTGGIKYDQGKARYDLIPADVEEEIAQVFTYGADKYGDKNWVQGIVYSRLYAACRRHLGAFRRGEKIDDSGRHHIAHAIANLMMMLHFELSEFKDLDDL